MSAMEEQVGISDVKQFYDNTVILITGATGFIGNMLVEKLLRSCPEIDRIYLLVRAKRGIQPNERLDKMFNTAVFQELCKKQPDFRKKIIPIVGDGAEPDLAISNDDYQMIINEVNIIFHVAANIKFNEPLRNIVKINLQCTKELLALAKKIKQLKAFLYVSTAYSQCSQKEIDECYYDPPIKCEKLYKIIELLDEKELESITPILIKGWPNTYTYTKAIAEDIVRSYSKTLPIIIVRPSIVGGSVKEPVPGWIQNWYGPVSFCAGVGAGVVHVINLNKHRLTDFVPVDYTVNAIIVACTRAELRNTEHNNETNTIYNYVCTPQSPLTWNTFRKLLYQQHQNFPFATAIWHSFIFFESNRNLYLIYNFFLQTVKGWIADSILVLFGKKPMLTKIYNKINATNDTLLFFMKHDWIFHNKNTVSLWQQLNPVDRKLFPFTMDKFNWSQYFKDIVIGCRIFLLKDPMHTLAYAKKKHIFLHVVHYIFVLLLIIGGFFFLKTVFQVLF